MFSYSTFQSTALINNFLPEQGVQGHLFHPDSQEKQEWILELSFGNAGPSSQAHLYQILPVYAPDYEFVNESRGSKSGTAWEPLAISRRSLRGPQPRDVDALALISSINKLNQHLFAQAGLQRDDVRLHGPRSAGAASFVVSTARLLTKKRVAKNFAWESRWAKWKQSWDFCTFQVHKIEVLRHLRTLPTVTPMSVRDVSRWSVDLVIWLNVINVTEHSSLPSLPNPFAKWLLSSPRCRMETAPGFSLWGVVMLHCGRSCLALISSINKFNQHLFAQAGLQRDDVTLHGPRSAGAASFCCFKSETLDQEAGTHGWEWLLYTLVM